MPWLYFFYSGFTQGEEPEGGETNMIPPWKRRRLVASNYI